MSNSMQPLEMKQNETIEMTDLGMLWPQLR